MIRTTIPPLPPHLHEQRVQAARSNLEALKADFNTQWQACREGNHFHTSLGDRLAIRSSEQAFCRALEPLVLNGESLAALERAYQAHSLELAHEFSPLQASEGKFRLAIIKELEFAHNVAAKPIEDKAFQDSLYCLKVLKEHTKPLGEVMRVLPHAEPVAQLADKADALRAAAIQLAEAKMGPDHSFILTA